MTRSPEMGPSSNPEGIAERILKKASKFGFDSAGWTKASPPLDFVFFSQWLSNGMHGEMNYLDKHRDARSDPNSILPGVKTILMVSMNYKPETNITEINGFSGKIARYARGPDYHEMLWGKLDKFGQELAEMLPELSWRGITDSAPLLERGYAKRCGLGWIGKNTLLINRQIGSFTVLGGLLLNTELPPNPFQNETPDSCGSCTRCLDACPTQALLPERKLDARQCISYWTIEKKGELGKENGSRLNGWLFGCDICQEVCPWNRKSKTGSLLGQKADLATLDCTEVLKMSDDQLRASIRGTALKRTKPNGLRRNALWILGSSGTMETLSLIESFIHSEDRGISQAALWAKEQIKERSASLPKIPTNQ